MKKFMKKCKRALVVALAIALVGTSVDLSMLYAQAEETTGVVSDVSGNDVQSNVSGGDAQNGVTGNAQSNATGDAQDGDTQSEWIEYTEEDAFLLPEIETSAFSMSMFTLTDEGKVALKSARKEKWIDRLDLTGADWAMTLYNNLTEWTDNDGESDLLISDATFSGSEYLVKVAEITGTLTGADATATNAETKAQEAYETLLSDYVPYVSAVVNAFDRDNSQVFWLNGTSATQRTMGYSGYENQSITYQSTLYLIVEGTVYGEPFDMRAVDYRDEATIKAAIADMNEDADAIVAVAAGKSVVEQIEYFNEWLTKNNEYNTVVSKIDTTGATKPDSAQACTSALAGSEGVNGPVCEGYARAFKVLCDKAGIPCVLVDGWAKDASDDDGEPHMWNYVQVDNNWYAVDVTWNDPLYTVAGVVQTGKVSGGENTNWLLVGSDTVIKEMKFIVSHPVENQVSSTGVAFTNGPELSTEKYVVSNDVASVTTSAGVETKYESLEEAFDAANEAGDGVTLKLLKSVSPEYAYPNPYSIKSDFKLDLNGYTLVLNNTLTVEKDGCLTIKDSSNSQSGKMQSTTSRFGKIIENAGTVKVTGGTISNVSERGEAIYSTAGEVIVEGGMVTTASEQGMAIRIKAGEVTVAKDAEVTNTGTFGDAIYIEEGNITVKGGKVTNTGANGTAIDSSAGKVTVEGGEVTSKGEDSSAINSGNSVVTVSGGKVANTDVAGYSAIRSLANVIICGGSVESATSADKGTIVIWGSEEEVSKLEISGGSVSNTGTDSAIYINEYVEVSITESTISASDSADYGVYNLGTLTLGEKGVIQGGNWTVFNSGTFTVNGGNVKGAKSNSVRNSDKGQLLINGGTIENTCVDGIGIYNWEDASVVMTGGTVKVAGSGSAIYNNKGSVTISGTSKIINNGSAPAILQSGEKLYLSGGATITGGGSAEDIKIERYYIIGAGYLNSKIQLIGALTNTTPYSVSYTDADGNSTGVFAEGGVDPNGNSSVAYVITASDAAKFTAANTSMQVKQDTTNNQLLLAYKPHEHSAPMTFENPWTATSGTVTSGTANAVSYYLVEDVDAESVIYIEGIVAICLNGHTLDMGSDYLEISDGAALVIYDCSTGEIGTITSECVVTINNLGSISLESGRIINTATSDGTVIGNVAGTAIINGGSLQCTGADSEGIYNHNGASLLLNGGSIEATGENSFGVFSEEESNFQMSGAPVIEAYKADLSIDTLAQIRITGALTGEETYTLDYYTDNDGNWGNFATASDASYLSNAKEKFVSIKEGVEVLVEDTFATLDYEKGELSISITWEDEDDKYGLRQQPISAWLYKEDGTETGEYIDSIDIRANTASANSNVWTATKEVYLYDANGRITYDVELIGLPEGYTANETSAEDGFAFELSLTHPHELKGVNPTVDGVEQKDVVELICINTEGSCNWNSIGVQLQTPTDVIYNGTAKQATINNRLGDSTVAQDVSLSAIVYERWDVTEENWVVIDADEVINVGDYRAKVTVSYDGSSATAQVEFAIEALDINAYINVVPYNGEYDPFAGEAGTPAVEVINSDTNINATIEYSTDGGTTWVETVPTLKSVGELEVVVKVTAPNYAEFKENYTAVMTAYDLSGCNVELEQERYYYTGQQIKPVVTEITDCMGRELPLTSADYEVTYGANVSVETGGTVSVEVTNGNYINTAQRSFDISYYDGAVEILYNGAELKDGYYNADVAISAEGYTVSKTMDGAYTDSVMLSGEGPWVEMDVYFKQDGTGYITQAIPVSANIDKTAPTFGEGMGILIDDMSWNTLAEQLTYDVYFKEAQGGIIIADDELSCVDWDELYYYIDKSGSTTAKTAAELDACDFVRVVTGDDAMIDSGTTDSDTNAGSGTAASGGASAGGGYAPGTTGAFCLEEDGKYVVYAYVCDNAGNKSAYISTNGIVIDTKAPGVEVTEPTKAAGTLTDTTLTFTVEVDEDAMVGIFIETDYSGETIGTTISKSDFTYWEEKEPDTQLTETIGGTTYIDFKTAVTANQAKEIIITGLTPNTFYEYSVEVYDMAENGTVVAGEEDTEDPGHYFLKGITTLKTVPTFATQPTITGTYGQKLSEMTVSQPVSTNNVPGTWSIAYAGAGQMYDMPAVDGTTAYEVKFTPSGDNVDRFESVIVEVIPTVAKMALTVTVDNQTKKYGEENPELTYVITEGSIVDANYAGRPRLTIALSTTATKTSNAGTYDITGTVTNDVNYDVTVKKGTLTIEQAEASITVETDKESYSKSYGDDSFTLSGISTNSDGTLTYAVTNSKNAAGQSVADDQIITVSATGKVTVVGAGRAEVVVSMAETTNYKAATDVTITVDVAKAAHTVAPIERGYAYNKDNADSIDLTDYVPTDAGNVVYTIVQTDGTASFVTAPTIDANGTLTYTLAKGTKGQYASVGIQASSDNYNDITMTVELLLNYEAMVELKAGSEVTAVGELTYGDTLGKLTFGEAVFVEEGTDTVVAGTLSWEASDSIPEVAITTAKWVFTPTNADYASVTGTTTIKVNKAAQPALSIVPVTNATYGQEDSIRLETTGGLEGAEITITVPTDNGVVTAVNTNGLGQFFVVPMAAGKVTVTAVAKDATGNYEDAVATYELTVAPATLEDVSWADEFTGEDTYTGNAITPAVEAYFIADGILTEDTDYTVKYVNNTNAYILAEGDADFDAAKAPAVVVTGKGNYTGTVTLYFVINKAENAPNMPASTRTVTNSTAIAGQVSLPESWIWQEPSATLAEGTETVAIAIYDGADKGNYVNEAVAVTITRLAVGLPYVAEINGEAVSVVEAGWNHVGDDLDAAEEGDELLVDMNGATVLPGNVIDNIKGKDITVILDMGNDVTWTINGKSITADTVADVNLQVDLNTANIPVDVVNKITGEIYTMQISLAHNGEFGYTATLTINLKAENAGYYAQLFHYEETAKELKFVVEKIIDAEGNAALPFTHASDYTIVIDDEQYKEPSNDNNNNDNNNNNNDSNNGSGSSTPATTPTPAPAAPSTPKSPQTGDTFPMESMMLWMTLALVAVGLSSVYGRRKNAK